ncbi:MAG: flagellar biosynthesis protein FlhF [Thermosediminibacterales bacterium]|nr:flagellar biosynthesis protein FlhF [Thermosediminibacterales bacterium]
MKIKKYIASDMQEAMYKVKKDLGKDAIILETKRVKKGGFLGMFSKRMIEVTAALDTRVNSIELPTQRLSYIKKTSDNNLQIKKMEQEINELKNMVYNLSNYEPVNNLYRDTETLEKVKKQLLDNEVDNCIAEEIIRSLYEKLSGKELKDPERVKDQLKNEIVNRLSEIFKLKQNTSYKVVAFVGPTGVGKTTSIAKLAANYALYENKKVALITMDTYRIAAVEQLKTYAEIIDIPLCVIYEPADFKEALEKYKDYDVILVDTAGISPKNKFQMIELKKILDISQPDVIYLVLSATTKTRDLTKIIDNYKVFNTNKLLFTKLDETSSYGAILNTILYSKNILDYVTIGQNVPEDIVKVNEEKIANLIMGENGYGRPS